jgi:hypothetical protein
MMIANGGMGSSGMIIKKRKFEWVRRGNGRFENSSGKSGRQHLGKKVTEELRSSGV